MGLKGHRVTLMECQGIVRAIRGDHQGMSGCPQVLHGFLRVFQGVSRVDWVYLSGCQGIAGHSGVTIRGCLGVDRECLGKFRG